MTRYTYICEKEECNYDHGFSMNFKPDEGRTCDKCGDVLKVVDKSTVAPKGQHSASIVSGVGEINSRLSGDWKDLMHKIKQGSPGSNMPDYK